MRRLIDLSLDHFYRDFGSRTLFISWLCSSSMALSLFPESLSSISRGREREKEQYKKRTEEIKMRTSQFNIKKEEEGNTLHR